MKLTVLIIGGLLSLGCNAQRSPYYGRTQSGKFFAQPASSVVNNAETTTTANIIQQLSEPVTTPRNMQSVSSNAILNPSFRISMPSVPSPSPRTLQMQPTIKNTVSNVPSSNDLFTPDVSDSSTMIKVPKRQPSFIPASIINSNNNDDRLLPSKTSAQIPISTNAENPSNFEYSDYDNFPVHPTHRFNHHHIPQFSHYDYDFHHNHGPHTHFNGK